MIWTHLPSCFICLVLWCCFCCCCWYCAPVREVCPNFEVVGFQPRTLNTPDLGSFAYSYFLLYPSTPIFSSPVFWIVHSVSPSPWTCPISPTFYHLSTLLLSIFLTISSSPSLAWPWSDGPPGHRSCPTRRSSDLSPRYT